MALSATKLQIGDYVFVKSKNKTGIVHDIARRDAHIWCGETYGSVYSDRYNYDDINPIPLTPEILEKNGWVWRTRYTIESLKLLSEDGHCLMSLTYGKKISVGGHEIEIKYVHTLQHALRLCGLNDLADNFQI